MPKINSGKAVTECRMIVFDRNGTLIDLRPFLLSLGKARLESLSKRVGAQIIDLWEKAVGINLECGWIDYDGPLATSPQREETLVTASTVYQCGYSWSEAKAIAQEAYDLADESLKPCCCYALFEGTMDKLEQLKSEGLKLAIATTDSHRRTEESLRFLGITRFFDVIVGGDDVENPKPAPDMVLEACRQTGCAPSETVVVGDSLSDMKMGKNAKVKRCIGVLTGFTSKDVLQQAADVTIESVTELKVKRQ